MAHNEDYPQLRDSALTAGLDDAQVETLSKKVTRCRTLQDGEVLFSEGDTDTDVYLITAGRFAAERGAASGRTTTLQVLEEGDVAGAMSFLSDFPHSATLRATHGPASVCVIERERLESLLDSDPRLVYLVTRNVVQVAHGIMHRMNLQHVEMADYISGNY